MIHCEVEEYDIQKLEDAITIVEKVYGYYYMSENSRVLVNRLDTIKKKLSSVIRDAREYQRRKSEHEQAKT